MKRSNQDMWVWVVSDATTKIIPVIQVGGRTQEMAYQVVHELSGNRYINRRVECVGQRAHAYTIRPFHFSAIDKNFHRSA